MIGQSEVVINYRVHEIHVIKIVSNKYCYIFRYKLKCMEMHIQQKFLSNSFHTHTNKFSLLNKLHNNFEKY